MELPFIRWTLTVALLFVVWYHTHWSVALCLTLIVAAIEIQGFNILRTPAAFPKARGAR